MCINSPITANEWGSDSVTLEACALACIKAGALQLGDAE